MPIGDQYKSTMAAENWDAVIIGSGISGLATARLLADAGKQVLVLEKHFKFGGYTHDLNFYIKMDNEGNLISSFSQGILLSFIIQLKVAIP